MPTVAPLNDAQSEIVAGLDSAFQPLALAHRKAVLERGIPFTFISGLRSRSQQDVLFHNPPTGVAAAPGSSKHEVGFAYDATGPRSQEEWAVFGQLAVDLGMTWGGNFRKPDNPHVEFAATRADLASYRTVKLLGIASLLTIGAAVAIRKVGN